MDSKKQDLIFWIFCVGGVILLTLCGISSTSYKVEELDKSMQMMEESLQLQREQVEILKNFEVDIK